MHDVDHAGRLDVAALRGRIAVARVHFFAAFAPDVALENVVIVGQAESRPVAHDFAEGPAMLVELAKVVQDRGSGRFADHAKAAVVLINLVAGKEDEVGVEFEQVLRHGRVRKSVIVLAGQRRHAQWASFRVGFDRSGPLMP